MLNIKPILIKHGYDITMVNNNYIITKNNKTTTINKVEFEKLLFVKLIDLIDEII